jgi:hypothetical protein
MHVPGSPDGPNTIRPNRIGSDQRNQPHVNVAPQGPQANPASMLAPLAAQDWGAFHDCGVVFRFSLLDAMEGFVTGPGRTVSALPRPNPCCSLRRDVILQSFHGSSKSRSCLFRIHNACLPACLLGGADAASLPAAVVSFSRGSSNLTPTGSRILPRAPTRRSMRRMRTPSASRATKQ